MRSFCRAYFDRAYEVDLRPKFAYYSASSVDRGAVLPAFKVKEEEVYFYSSGLKLHGAVYLPDEPIKSKQPTIIIISGYQGFKSFYPHMFAKELTKFGYVCFGFDYRGFADSEGISGRVILREQVLDTLSALHYLRTRKEVDSDRIGLVGWGMGASNAISAAAKEPRIKALAAINGFYTGARWLQSVLPKSRWKELLKEIDEDRINRAINGSSKQVEPFQYYPLDTATSSYVKEHLAILQPFGVKPTLEFLESIIELNTEQAAMSLNGRPLMVAHGKDNRLHPLAEAESLYKHAVADKTFHLINGKHNDFMISTNPIFLDLVEKLDQFFVESLKIKRKAKKNDKLATR